jgi:hypothetical protein
MIGWILVGVLAVALLSRSGERSAGGMTIPPPVVPVVQQAPAVQVGDHMRGYCPRCCRGCSKERIQRRLAMGRQ